METKPLVVIVGPTASGKTALAIKLALEFGGEIICADSRTVYKGLDIGTAKPSREDQSLVQHWGLDLVEPNERFTAADFKQYATQKIKEIRSRGRIPFLVGGTGLYVDGIVFDFQFGTKIDEKFRAELEKMTVEELQKYCNEHNVQLPENNKNQRYLIRSIEQNGINNSRKNEPINNLIIVGITTDKKILRSRIEERADNLFSSGVIEEAKMLAEKYGWDSEAMTGNIYKLSRLYLNNEITTSELKERFIISDWHLAKRQMTWLKRDKFIKWFDLDEAEQHITSLLASIR